MKKNILLNERGWTHKKRENKRVRTREICQVQKHWLCQEGGRGRAENKGQINQYSLPSHWLHQLQINWNSLECEDWSSKYLHHWTLWYVAHLTLRCNDLSAIYISPLLFSSAVWYSMFGNQDKTVLLVGKNHRMQCVWLPVAVKWK